MGAKKVDQVKDLLPLERMHEFDHAVESDATGKTQIYIGPE